GTGRVGGWKRPALLSCQLLYDGPRPNTRPAHRSDVRTETMVTLAGKPAGAVKRETPPPTGHRRASQSKSGRALDLIESLREVGDEIVGVLDAHGQADEIGG